MTVEEWAALPEDVDGELVDDLLQDEEVPDFIHEIVVAWIITALSNWLRGKGGFVAGSEAKFAVTPHRGRKPDVSVYLPGGRLPPPRGLIRVPPDIAVEVISPAPRDAGRDRVQKFAEYATFGVRYYWLVDPVSRTFELFELGSDRRYVRALGAAEGTIENIPGCEGLSVDVSALWAEIDRLSTSTDFTP